MDDQPLHPEDRAPSTVVFDIGEVLVDETRVWAVWAALIGVSPLTFGSVLGAAITQGEDHEVVFPYLAPNIDWRELLDEHEQHYGGFQGTDLYPDVRPCLSDLRDAGFGVVLAGNQPSQRTAQLAELGLTYDVAITSDELGVEKPDPAFFSALAEHLEVDDLTTLLYVGDRVDNDILPAATAGWRTCWLQRGPWGRLQALPDELTPDLALEGLGELATLLAQWRGDGGA